LALTGKSSGFCGFFEVDIASSSSAPHNSTRSKKRPGEGGSPKHSAASWKKLRRHQFPPMSARHIARNEESPLNWPMIVCFCRDSNRFHRGHLR
jgi:hypothetical protein